MQIDDEAVAVLHQRVGGVRELRLLPSTLSSERYAKELASDVVREKALAVLREDRRNEALLDHVHVHEPAEEQVVVELLAELTLASDRVESHQQRRLEQSLGRDGRSPDLGIHRAEHGRELAERGVRQLLDRPKRVVRWYPGFRRHEHQHRVTAWCSRRACPQSITPFGSAQSGSAFRHQRNFPEG